MSDQARLPRASEAKVLYHQNQIRKLFSRADDSAFLQMVWAVDALQSGREGAAKKHLTSYPPKAAMASPLPSIYGIPRWELETLIVQLLSVPKEPAKAQGNLRLDCSTFDSIALAINRLRALETVESARYLSGDFTIWGELHRIAQRQFHWQRGYFNGSQIYRYTYLYGQGKCADYFRRTYGFEITDLIFTGFGFFSGFLATPRLAENTSVVEIGLTDEIVGRALPMIACSLEEARAETTALIKQVQEQHGAPIPTALLPSNLRKKPLLRTANQLVSPIPEAILLRISSGLYYDLISGGQEIIDDANRRFEHYCIDLIDSMMDQFDVSGEFHYGPKGGQFKSPDVQVKRDGKIVILAECKATRLTYRAQFSENPFEAARNQYAQIAKGIFQLWRYFSHVRLGLVDASLAADCHAVVLTLDTFLYLARDPKNKVFAEANALADNEGGISPDDRKHVSICAISDFEVILTCATETSLLASLTAARSQKYEGWMLREIHRDTGAPKEFGTPKPYPFQLETVLPWWKRLDGLADTTE